MTAVPEVGLFGIGCSINDAGIARDAAERDAFARWFETELAEAA